MSVSNVRRSMPPQLADQPVKKQSKWSPEEDALIIELRGSGMKWEDVSKRLPGRSAISCRLHYQNYLERRSEWDDERKNKLARLYERFKSEMWAKVAEELAVPWRAAEAMHWQLGENDMARRAGVVPFSLAAVNVEGNQRTGQPPPPPPPPRAASVQFQAQDTVTRHMTPPSPRMVYSRNAQMSTMPTGQMPPRPDTIGGLSHVPPPAGPPQGPPQAPQTPSGMGHGVMTEHGEFYYSSAPSGPGLAPIQVQGQPRNPGPLPSLAELTTGVSPYVAHPDRPQSGHSGHMDHPASKYRMPQQTQQTHQGFQQHIEISRPKRRASPDMMLREESHRRRLG